MDQYLSARLPESAVPVPPSNRLRHRSSGTRRIVTASLPNPVSGSTAPVPGPAQGLDRSSAAAPRWLLAEPLRSRSLAISIAVATLAGGAAPLLAPSSHGSTLGAGVAMGVSLFSLGLATLAWTAPHWQAEARLDRLWSWLELNVKLLSFDVRALPRAPKNLALSLASHWLLRAGVAGLLGAGALSLAQQLLGMPIASRPLGLSLASAALVVVSRLLAWALRLQPHLSAEPSDTLALAAREFPAIVDASRPLELDTLFLQPTLLHRVVELLPSWRDRVRGTGADGHAAALQRHLWRGLPLAQMVRQHGSGAAQADGVAEFVIDDAVLVAVQVGIDRTRSHALAERLRNQAARVGARATVVVVVEAGAEALLCGDVAQPLRSLRETLPVVVAVLP